VRSGVCVTAAAAISLAASPLGLLACAKPGEAPEGLGASASAEAPVSRVGRWVAPRSPELAPALELPARVLSPPDGRAELAAPVEATITRVHVAEGQRVRAGDRLVDLHVPEAIRAEGALAGARLRAAAHGERLGVLVALQREGLARGGELADVRARHAEALADERGALASLRALDLAGVAKHGDQRSLVSPIEGVVLGVSAPLGASRGPDDPPLVTIAGGRARRLEARASFTLPKGGTFTLAQPGEAPIALELVSEAPQVSVHDSTRLVWLDLREPTALAHGALVRVRYAPEKGSWLVPRGAVVREAGRSIVHTKARGAVPVTVLGELPPDALVAGALEASDRVAEEGSLAGGAP
jgi:multidrug efflux pump subunit AcrA (membrane-fusion protein)